MRVIKTASIKENKTWLNKYKIYLIKKTDLADETVRGYVNDLNAFIHWLANDYELALALTDVSLEELRSFRNWQKKKKRFTVATINRRINSLKHFYKWLSKVANLPDNPTLGIKYLKLNKARQPKSLNKKEIHALLSASGTSQHGLAKRNLAIVHLMLQAGLRVGELVSLQVKDLELEYRNGKVRLVNCKGNKIREVPLNATARKALRDYLGDRVHNLDEYIFQTKRNTPIALRTVEATIKNLAVRAGIDHPVSPHMLRHTFAINYLKTDGGSLDKLAELLGHDTLDTTAIYTRVTNEELSDDVENMPFNYDND